MGKCTVPSGRLQVLDGASIMKVSMAFDDMNDTLRCLRDEIFMDIDVVTCAITGRFMYYTRTGILAPFNVERIMPYVARDIVYARWFHVDRNYGKDA